MLLKPKQSNCWARASSNVREKQHSVMSANIGLAFRVVRVSNYVSCSVLHMKTQLPVPVKWSMIAVVHIRPTLLCKWPQCTHCAKRKLELFWWILLKVSDHFIWWWSPGPGFQHLQWYLMRRSFLIGPKLCSFLYFDQETSGFYVCFPDVFCWQRGCFYLTACRDFPFNAANLIWFPSKLCFSNKHCSYFSESYQCQSSLNGHSNTETISCMSPRVSSCAQDPASFRCSGRSLPAV